MRDYRPQYRGDAGVRREFDNVRKAALRPDEFVLLDVHHAAPEKLEEGIILIADGTDWNPGAGAGVYAYYGGAWNRLG